MLIGLAALAPALAAPTCNGSGQSQKQAIRLTVNAIPDDQNDVLVVPPSGFTVDLTFPYPAEVIPDTLLVKAFPFDGSAAVNLTPAVVDLRSDGAVVVVPPGTPLSFGSHTIAGWVQRTNGTWGDDRLDVAVRQHAIGAPLETPQWIQLDFEADRDGDGLPDFPDDLTRFGLISSADPSLSFWVQFWIMREIGLRAQGFYHTPDPSRLPGGDAADVTFRTYPPDSGLYTRICVGGEDPTGGPVIGNVRFDPGNGNLADVACDDMLATGIFPRELWTYSGDSTFQDVFDPLVQQPLGTHPLDSVVLSPDYDPSDSEQRQRREDIDLALDTFAQAVATIAAHESGHALGLVPPGPPGGGLYGGRGGAAYTHDLMPDGSVPSENLLMNQGSTFSFRRLIGWGSTPLPRLRELDFAYLRGRLVLDSGVTGIYPPPEVTAISPVGIPSDEGYTATITITGAELRATPSVRLIGPVIHSLLSEIYVSSTEVTGTVTVPQIAPGVYDVELTNPDGQRAILPDAFTVY